MGKLKSLITTIRNENKMDVDEIIDSLVKAICECDEDCAKDVYVCLYKKSFGDNVTKDVAHEWVKSFPVTDGSNREHGEKWTIEQTTDVGNRIGLNWNEISKCDWYVVLNMEYYKHYDTAKAYGNENDSVWFAHIAKDEWYHRDKSLFEYYVEYAL